MSHRETYFQRKNASHGETHLRQISHRQTVLYSLVHDIKQRQVQTAAGRPLHRIFRASPHSCGGAFYAVTHSQRKYHHTCMRIVARCLAIAALRRWPCSLRPPDVRPPFTGDSPGVPAAWLHAYRMYLIALFSCNQTISGPQGRTLIHSALLPDGKEMCLTVRRILK